MSAIETKIPLFPLPMLVLPGERRILHIFEPRYIQLLADLDDQFPVFGIPHFTENKKESEVVYGSLVKVIKVLKKYPGGESDIVIEAIDLFELRSFEMKQEGKNYPAGLVLILKDYKDWKMGPELRKSFSDLLVEIDETADLSSELGLFDILLKLEIKDEERIKFLNLNSRKSQETKLLALLKLTTLIKAQEKRKEFNFFMN